MEHIFNTIPYIKNAHSISPLQKGFSHDDKFIVTFTNKKPVILRISNEKNIQHVKQEADLLQTLVQKGVNCTEILEAKSMPHSKLQYSIYSYIEGEDAADVLPTLSESHQFELGQVAGRQLARIHTVSAPSDLVSWSNRATEKHHNYLRRYKTYDVKLDNDAALIEFIDQHLYLMENRPNQLQHDDFHLHNIMIKDQQHIGIVDFGGYDWGDPIHDFVKIALFTRHTSISFSIGQLHGYYPEGIPHSFWKLYSLYVAMTLFSSVVWSIEKAPKQLDQMLYRLKTVQEDHSVFKHYIPSWYSNAYGSP